MDFPNSGGQPAWFALTVRPQHERTAAADLARRGISAYVPWCRTRRRRADRVKEIEVNLFPGYVFCRFGYEHWLEARKAAGVTSVVGFGRYPEPVPDAEMEALRRALASGLGVAPWPHLRAGQRVRILCGALEGVEGILVRDKDHWRVIVSVELLRRSVAVEIDRGMIGPSST